MRFSFNRSRQQASEFYFGFFTLLISIARVPTSASFASFSTESYVLENPTLSSIAPKCRSCHRRRNLASHLGHNVETSDSLITTKEIPLLRESSRREFFKDNLALNAALLTVVTQASPVEAVSSDSLQSSSISNAATTTSTSTTLSPPPDLNQILKKASKKALSGGKAGASASVVQVLSLMWLRTSMNYQYRYGGTLSSSLSKLYNEGGIPRFYQGLPFALIQGPLTRFGDTAANVGILALLDSVDFTMGMPLPLKTLCGSLTAGIWRIFLMPVDTSKTVMQVEGAEGLDRLWQEVSEGGSSGGVGALYRGAFASAAATTVGHFPWFLTYNYLNEVLPAFEEWSIVASLHDPNIEIIATLARSAVLGIASSCVSDCCSNSLRVIKTTKQTASRAQKDGQEREKENDLSTEKVDADSQKGDISYAEAVSLILEEDGWKGLFGRGLQTRLLTNAVQGAIFSVLWRYFQQVGR